MQWHWRNLALLVGTLVVVFAFMAWAGVTLAKTLIVAVVVGAFMPRVRRKVGGGHAGPRTYGPSGD
jgi:Flp pilus assembly protein TadB